MKSLWFMVALCFSISAVAYTSAHSSEAEIRFDNWVKIPGRKYSSKAAQEAIQAQLLYMVGALVYGPVAAAPREGIPVPDSDIKIEKSDSGGYLARYHYHGIIALTQSTPSSIVFGLPLDPSSIYNLTEQNKKRSLNPCTDPADQDEPSFFYFWSMDRPGCRDILTENEDFVNVRATLSPLPKANKSYPEYIHLPDADGRIQITVLFGKNEFSRIRSPQKAPGQADDLNAKSFRQMSKALEQLGFVGREWKSDEIKNVVTKPLRPYPYVKEYTYKYTDGRAKELVVEMVYTNSLMDHQDKGLRYFLKHALETSSVLIYDGHSGLGSNLDDEGIGHEKRDLRLHWDKKKYQIYFFNSCTSYSFYNDAFFNAKAIEGSADSKGSQYLDIITAVLETPFEGDRDSNFVLVNTIHEWARGGHISSYQQLMDDMDIGNGLGVNGDEDNPTHPSSIKF
jgi:hypothetical protein